MFSRGFFSWLSARSPRSSTRPRRRQLLLEVLEDRSLPTVGPVTFTFTVDRPTDLGTSQAGVGNGTSGDLRYCIAQANATHGGAGSIDDIFFNSTVFNSLKTINLSATLGTLSITDPHTLTIQGPSSSVDINANNSFGIFSNSGVNVTFNLVSITHGNANVFGGAIANSGTVTLNNCTIENNQAPYGGAIVNEGGTVTMTGCTVDNNTAQFGGGLINLSGTLNLTNCTLYNNSATNGDGGGLLIYSGTATLTNCTFDANSASGRGGGIYNNGTLNMTNTILAFDTAGNATAGPDILNSGQYGTMSHNLVRIGDGGDVTPLQNGTNGNQIGNSGSPIDPKFDPRGLQNNGGPTKTIAIVSGSPAIDAGDDSVLSTVTTDQRGLPRRAGAHVDIGAFEVQPAPTTTTQPGARRTSFFNTP